MSQRLCERWDAKLENWAMWRCGLDQVSRRISERNTKIRKGDWKIDTSEPPPKPQPLVGEALDTDRLVRKLSDEQQQAITVRYVWTYPETMEQRAAELGCTRMTLHNRVVAAMECLENMDQERRSVSVRYTALVEQYA